MQRLVAVTYQMKEPAVGDGSLWRRRSLVLEYRLCVFRRLDDVPNVLRHVGRILGRHVVGEPAGKIPTVAAVHVDRPVDIVPGAVVVELLFRTADAAGDVGPNSGLPEDPPVFGRFVRRLYVARHLLQKVLAEPRVPLERVDDFLTLLGAELLPGYFSDDAVADSVPGDGRTSHKGECDSSGEAQNLVAHKSYIVVQSEPPVLSMAGDYTNGPRVPADPRLAFRT